MSKIAVYMPFFLSLNLYAQTVPCPPLDLSTLDEKNNISLIGSKIAQDGVSLQDKDVPQPKKELVEVAKRLNNLSQCADKVWPNFKIEDTTMRMRVSESIDQDLVYLYNPKTGKFEYERPSTPADIRVMGFDYNLDNDGGILVNATRYIERPKDPNAPPPPKGGQQYPFCPEENKAYDKHLESAPKDRSIGYPSLTDRLFSFSTHEAFHKVDQNPDNMIHQHAGSCHWAPELSDRALNGELDELKIGRQHLIRALLDAYKEKPGTEARANAVALVKAWNEKLNKEFPNEMKQLSGVDRNEGTAEYTGLMSGVYGKYGCNPTEEEKREHILKSIESRYQPVIQDLDMQGYLIGAVSGLLLDDEKDTTWKDKVTKEVISPLAVLEKSSSYKKLSKVEAKKNDVIMASIPVSKKLDDCKKLEVEKNIAPILKQDEEYVIVELDEGPIGTNGGFTAFETPNKESIVVSLSSTSNGENINAKQQTFIKIKELCGSGSEGSNFVAIPKRLIDSNGVIKGDQQYNVSGKVNLKNNNESWQKHQVACQS